ncbi:MAG: carbohydrate binding domain-containing protein, partial [Lentisphaerota bacterium]
MFKLSGKLCFLTATLSFGLASGSFAFTDGLPDYEPPFAAKEWKPQAVELKIWDVPSKSGTEIQPYLICGNKKVGCRETSFGLKAPGICDQLMSVLIDGKVFASWQISGWIPGFDGGHPFTTKDGTTPEITADKEKQSFTFRKEYQMSKDETDVYSQTASPAGDGKVLFTYDMGISPEKFATLPKGSGLSPEFYFEKPSLDLGLSVNGERLKLIPLEELMALPKNQSGSIRKPLKTFEACDEIVVSPDNPAAGFTLRLRAKGKVAIFEGYYQGRRSLSLNLPCDPEKVNGSFVIDFGASAVADKDAPPPLCGVDFWKNDRMHIPAPTSRNLMPNPSFEQGLRYWNWFSTGSSKYEPQPGNAPCYELSDDAKFGHFALKCNGTWGNRPLMSFPIPVLNGKTYTVSFYAKALTPTNFTLGLGTMIENGTPGWPEALGKSWNAGTDWQRYSYTVKAGAPALQLFFAGPKNSTVFLDGLQLEEGEQVTDFVSPEVEGRLVTSDPDNSLQPGDTFNAAMEISGVPGISGEVLISVFDYYREKLYECKFPFVLDKDGLGKIALPMDYKTLGKGFFVVKAEYRVAGKEPIFDYYRLSVMDYLDKKHATNELFGNSCSASVITRGDDLARQFIRWGWGSTSVGGLDDVLLKYRITNYCAAIYWGLLDANQLKALFGENYKDYAHHGSLKFNILLDVLSADDKLPLIEQFSYEIAKKYPNQKRWSWDGELDGRSDLIRHGDFSGYAKLITAMHRGI